MKRIFHFAKAYHIFTDNDFVQDIFTLIVCWALAGGGRDRFFLLPLDGYFLLGLIHVPRTILFLDLSLLFDALLASGGRARVLLLDLPLLFFFDRRRIFVWPQRGDWLLFINNICGCQNHH